MVRSDIRAQFFISEKDFPRLVRINLKEFPRSFQVTGEIADRVCAHKFNLLGSGEKTLGPEIDWQRDFKSGYRWSRDTPSGQIRFGHKRGVDIKVPWELSRFQHLVILGKAYWYAKTGIAQSAERRALPSMDPRKYLREFVGEIEDWLKNNPVGYGVNWVCPMEAAIRAVNWIWAYYFFRTDKGISKRFWEKFIQSLKEHGEYIYENLESEFPRTNHYLADLLGLFFIALVLPEFKRSKEWLAFSYYELIGEMKSQVSPEGVDYEGSTHYHCLVTEFFLAAYLLGKKNEVEFPLDFKQKLERMLEFLMAITKENGLIPQIGDNDSGRLWLLGEDSFFRKLDWRYLLNQGAVLFRRPDFKAGAGRFREENLWLLGEKGMADFERLPVMALPQESRVFPASGYCLLRSTAARLLVDCLPENRSAPWGHRHNSRLSFELSLGDEDLVVDPGSYIYTADPAQRNLFRSTAYHNTVLLDKKEQNRFSRRHIFEFREQSGTRILRRGSTDDFDLLELEFKWHHPENSYQRRFYRLDKKQDILLIKDTMEAAGNHRISVFFHFSPRIRLSLLKKEEMEGISPAGGGIFFKLLSPLAGVKMLMRKTWFSPAYGEKIKSRALRISANFRDKIDLIYMIIPWQDKEERQRKIHLKTGWEEKLDQAGIIPAQRNRI